MAILIRNGTLICMDPAANVFKGDVLVEKSCISKIARKISPPKGARVVDADNQFVLPGLIQSHTHLCQVLFRGLADDMPLLKWLKQKIWPMESAHNAASMSISAQLGLLELHLSGTTSILDMGSVNHTDRLFAAAEKAKMRYWGGKCLMDVKAYSGPLCQDTNTAIEENNKLIKKWHLKNSLLNYVNCPRFVLSCSTRLLDYCRQLQQQESLLVHTHGAETKDENRILRAKFGRTNIKYFDKIGLLNNRTIIAHGVHLTKSEVDLFVKRKAKLSHCPSANLKLASGIAPIDFYLSRKMHIGLGTDGAPCNNLHDQFSEMRLTALLQKPIFGPQALNAFHTLSMATIGGARVLGVESKLGSLEAGKLADIITVNRNHPATATVDDPYSALVYSTKGDQVKNVIINGQFIVKNGRHQLLNDKNIYKQSRQELKKLIHRVARQ